MNTMKNALNVQNTEINTSVNINVTALRINSEILVSGVKSVLKFKDGIYIYADTVFSWKEK